MKEIAMLISGFIGSLFCHLFGGWDRFLEALIIFMVIDYVSGFASAWFGKSPKSASGRLLSSAMFQGLCKKGMMLLFVVIGYKLDQIVGADYIKAAVVFAFIINELLSIIENAGQMGIPIPDVLKKAIEVLNNKNKKGE